MEKVKIIGFYAMGSMMNGGDVSLSGVVDSLNLGDEFVLDVSGMEGLLHMNPRLIEFGVSDLEVGVDGLHVSAVVVVWTSEGLDYDGYVP